jgi:hypothetical protein
MILITSADYIVDELKIEFGKIPPTFLPVGNLRLFVRQINILKNLHKDEIFLSLPCSYKIKPYDYKYLNSNGIKIIMVPDNLSLGKSIAFVINTIKNKNQNLIILHGDTLLSEIPLESDFISVSNEDEQYSWEYDEETKYKTIWCGLFSFSNSNYFNTSLTNADFDFINAVKLYSNSIYLKRLKANNWSDFGHVVTFYKNRCKITTERSFNNLNISNSLVTKTSSNDKKIFAELEWFLNLPTRLKLNSPQLIDYKKTEPISYTLEYLYYPTLSELFVFGEQDLRFWKNIFACCFKYLNISLEKDNNLLSNSSHNINNSIVKDKTLIRLEELNKSKIWDINQSIYLNGKIFPSLQSITETLFKYAIDNKNLIGYLHGDFCFSNILFDIRSNNIKVIDPRGIDGNNNLIKYGDIYYDYAKLSHSVIGCYDFIIAEMYYLKQESNNQFIFEIYIDNRLSEIQNEFIKELKLFDRDYKKIFSQMILLFISMIPLHKDNLNRQHALILNAFRLFNIFNNI